MKILVGYATSEGQTRKIARHIADRITDAGETVELLSLKDADGINLARFDRVLLAAPIHVGHYPRPLNDFAHANSAELNSRPSFFVSVSLAAAGHESDDWKGLEDILDDFMAATGWTPGRVEQIAGAYKPSEYDILKRFLMRRIISSKDPEADPQADKEYTDWDDLDSHIDHWIADTIA